MSSMEPNIRFLGIGRLSDGLILASHTQGQRGGNTELQKVVSKVLTSGNFGPKSQLTVTINESVGTLHLSSSEDTAFAVVADPNFSRRICFQLLSEAAEAFKDVAAENPIVAVEKELGLQKQANSILKKIVSNAEGEGDDKITTVNKQVDEVKGVMENNINKIIQNAESLSAVEDKSEALRTGAATFQKRSDQIKKSLWWRNFKMKLIVGLLVFAILGYIFIPMIIKANKDD